MKSCIFVFFLLLAVFVAHPILAQDNASAVNFPAEIVEVLVETCPVMGGKINKSVNTIVDGKLYYFCCPGCIGSFAADPGKFADKMQAAVLTTLKVTNTDGKCPETGLAADLKFFTIDTVAKTITFYHNKESRDKNTN